MNVINTLKSTTSLNAFNETMNNSSEFETFFNSFISGENQAIKLRFTDAGLPDDEKGRGALMYQGQWVGDLTSIPDDAKLEDFELLVSINPKLFEVGKMVNDADRTITLIHEMMLHINNACGFLNESLSTDGLTVNGSVLIKVHNDHYKKDGDHMALTEEDRPGNYFMPYKIVCRDMISHYKSRNLLTEKTIEFRGKQYYTPYWKLLQDAYESETTRDTKKSKPIKL